MDLLDGLVGHWPLDRQSYDQATHQFSDKSAEGNHGTGNGDNLGDTFDFNIDQHGIGGGATPFGGDGDYVNCGNNSSLNITDTGTFCAWIKCHTTVYAYAGIITKGLANSYRIFTNLSDKLFFRLQIGAEAFSTEISSTLGLNVWRFIAATYDKDAGSNNQKLYIDGVVDRQRTTTGVIGTGEDDVRIGTVNTVSSFDGSISDVRIFNRALSQDEITWLYLEQKKNAYETVTILKPLDKPVRISKERSLIVLKKGENCGI